MPIMPGAEQHSRLRDEIVEMINDANDENALPKERAESVAQVITTIFRLCR